MNLIDAIQSGYHFGEVTLLGKSFVYLHAREQSEITSSIIAKHLNWIEERFGKRGILITKTIESYTCWILRHCFSKSDPVGWL
jgi:hypothetical protein